MIYEPPEQISWFRAEESLCHCRSVLDIQEPEAEAEFKPAECLNFYSHRQKSRSG